MEISKLKTLTTPNLEDVLPILDINGGISGKPILRKATLGSLLVLADSNSAFQVPTVIKTAAENGDYFIGIDSTGTPYKISKADLLAGLSSGGSSGGSIGSSGTTTDPYFSDVVFLSHFDDLVDVKGKTITTGGNAQISTEIKKYGTGSALFDGNGDYFSIESSSDLNFSSGQDFTIEFFVKFTSISSLKVLLARSVMNSDNTFNLDMSATNLRITGWYTVYIDQPHNMVTNTWYYIAVTREANILKLYKNGTLLGSYTGNTNFPNINNFTFGGDPLSGAGATILGNIDEARITIRARAISGIPSAAFPHS